MSKKLPYFVLLCIEFIEKVYNNQNLPYNMTNNSKMSLMQWPKLFPYFSTVVLLFLILLLQLAEQSSSRKANDCEKQEQTECCHACTAPILHKPFHITQAQTASEAISLQKPQFSVHILTTLSLNEPIPMKISMYPNSNAKRQTQNIHLTPCR